MLNSDSQSLCQFLCQIKKTFLAWIVVYWVKITMLSYDPDWKVHVAKHATSVIHLVLLPRHPFSKAGRYFFSQMSMSLFMQATGHVLYGLNGWVRCYSAFWVSFMPSAEVLSDSWECLQCTVICWSETFWKWRSCNVDDLVGNIALTCSEICSYLPLPHSLLSCQDQRSAVAVQ